MCRITIEYIKCRTDLNFEVDFGVHGDIGDIVTKCRHEIRFLRKFRKNFRLQLTLILTTPSVLVT